jgi:hypothetical protein
VQQALEHLDSITVQKNAYVIVSEAVEKIGHIEGIFRRWQMRKVASDEFDLYFDCKSNMSEFKEIFKKIKSEK